MDDHGTFKEINKRKQTRLKGVKPDRQSAQEAARRNRQIAKNIINQNYPKMGIIKIGTQMTRKSMALFIDFVDGNIAGTMQGLRTFPSAASSPWLTYNQPS